jgi:PAS domain S-box-containing protein
MSGSAPPTQGPHGLDDAGIFRTLHAAYPDALLVVDAAGVIVLANPAAASLLGYATEELVGMGVETLVPQAVRARHVAWRSGYAHKPLPRPMGTDMNLVALKKDGSEVMVEIALSPLQSQGLPYTVAAIRGIGEYPRVKQALQRARYSELLAQLGRVAVDTRDPDVLLDQVPKVAVEALQVELASVLLLEPDGLAFRVASGVGLSEGERVGDLVANRRDTLPGRVLAEGRTIVIGPDDPTTMPRGIRDAGLVHGTAVPLSDRGRIIGALKVRSTRPQRLDGEELRFLESLSSLLATTLQRTRSEEALNHAARLESVGQLTGGIAHDFNNLLTVIHGNLQVLEALPSIAQDATAPALIAAATRAARRGADLTRKLLAFSRRQVLQPTAIDVAALLDSLADMLRRTVDQRIRISVESRGVPACRADPAQLESALLNIAINARDAMPEGGTLAFRATLLHTLPPAVQADIDVPSPTGYVAIAIADTGSGMSEEVRERAFEPFFTTKPAGRGTGLGLSTVYGFVRQSHGAIAIDSALGAGTTITLYIPAAGAADVERGADAAPARVPPGLRVLLVEDDAEVRQVAVRFLDSFGCRITECATAEQAQARMEAGDAHDLLLTDIALGTGMRGTELAAWASARQPGLGVLLVSGFSSELVDADRDSPPEWELLGKPYGRDELAAAVARAVRR